MKILMCSAQPYLPQVAGGAQASTHELCLESRDLGHTVSALTGLGGTGWTALRARILFRLRRERAVSDKSLGYPVFRAWYPERAVAEVARRTKPDVAVIPTSKAVSLGRSLQDVGIPLVVYLRDVEFHELEGSLSELPRAKYIANSIFTAKAYEKAFGIDAVVIPPLFRRELYQTATNGKFVTFVNPHPSKGVDVALALADRLPDIPFCFGSGWQLPPEEDRRLRTRLASLPNVVLRSRTRRMRDIYRKTKLLLAPSRWEEAWGRVVSEAQFSGIPVIATQLGGLPESVGPGGLLIARDAPIETWVEAVERVWRDPGEHETLSRQALAYSQRPELDRRRQMDTFMAVLTAAASSR